MGSFYPHLFNIRNRFLGRATIGSAAQEVDMHAIGAMSDFSCAPSPFYRVSQTVYLFAFFQDMTFHYK